MDVLIQDLHRGVLEPARAGEAEAGTAERYISTLDPELDALLGGGIACGQLTEVVGERFVIPSSPERS